MTVLGNGKAVSDWTDEARRHVGRGLDALGFGPDETPYRVVAEWTAARLRAYHPKQTSAGPVVLIIPAPFKRAYIWDLLPPVSVVRRCRDRGMRVFLLALLWHSCHRTKSEASPADWTSQAQGAGQMVKQPTPDGRQGRLWRRPGSFSPPWRRASVDAAGTSRRSMSAAHAGADRAMNGPRSDRARALP
jgi:hypothetical protein